MGDQISWFVELAVKPGQLDNFQALTGEMVEATRRERGVLTYQRFVSTDCKLVLVYERYADSATELAHLRQFEKNFARRFSEMVDRTRFTVLGNPSDELSALLDGFGVAYLKPFGDFAYTHPGSTASVAPITCGSSSQVTKIVSAASLACSSVSATTKAIASPT